MTPTILFSLLQHEFAPLMFGRLSIKKDPGHTNSSPSTSPGRPSKKEKEKDKGKDKEKDKEVCAKCAPFHDLSQ